MSNLTFEQLVEIHHLTSLFLAKFYKLSYKIQSFEFPFTEIDEIDLVFTLASNLICHSKQLLKSFSHWKNWRKKFLKNQAKKSTFQFSLIFKVYPFIRSCFSAPILLFLLLKLQLRPKINFDQSANTAWGLLIFTSLAQSYHTKHLLDFSAPSQMSFSRRRASCRSPWSCLWKSNTRDIGNCHDEKFDFVPTGLVLIALMVVVQYHMRCKQLFHRQWVYHSGNYNSYSSLLGPLTYKNTWKFRRNFKLNHYSDWQVFCQNTTAKYHAVTCNDCPYHVHYLRAFSIARLTFFFDPPKAFVFLRGLEKQCYFIRMQGSLQRITLEYDLYGVSVLSPQAFFEKCIAEDTTNKHSICEKRRRDMSLKNFRWTFSASRIQIPHDYK